MVVWLVWEFADTPADLRDLLRAYVAGSWVLAILTLALLSARLRLLQPGKSDLPLTGKIPMRLLDFSILAFLWRPSSSTANATGSFASWRLVFYRSDSSLFCLRHHAADFWPP